MKMHLVMAAAFAGLCSHAAFAASEGGDTWSQLQPQADTRSIQSPVAATSASTTNVQRGFPMAASEGGDTWSAVPKAQRSAHSALRDTPRPWAEDSAWVGSEGGDTWSELQPRANGDATQPLMAAH
jgi:photosystem II stability/assembly factor-like uncharacterized protein